jgi:hypothetical protein
MDIKLPVNLLTPSSLSTLMEKTLAVKIGQTVDVKVISALLKTESTALLLKLANDTLSVESNQPVKLAPNQNIQLQVTQTSPVLEFAMVTSAAELKAQKTPLLLRLQTTAATLNQPISENKTNLFDLPVKQPLAAKIVALTDDKIQLQVFPKNNDSKTPPKPSATTASPTPVLISLNRSDVKISKTASPQPSARQAATSATKLSAGQTVIIEIEANGNTPSVKLAVLPAAMNEEKLAELVKQFLPKHEPVSALLNPLIKALPNLLQKPSMPELLQRIAGDILQNLPPRQQLNESAGLKQAILDSGLYLEAKLTASTVDTEFTFAQDLKAKLLKLLAALRPEEISQAKFKIEENDQALLKYLQQKTENSLAKLTLDQLSSLPKDDNPKQIWTMSIPFVEHGYVDTVSIQIEREIEANQASDNAKDHWNVTLTLNPPGLGLVQCHLTYRNQTLNTVFRSERPQTRALISQHIDFLIQQFEQAGLKTGLITIHESLLASKAIYPNAGQGLLDQTA